MILAAEYIPFAFNTENRSGSRTTSQPIRWPIQSAFCRSISLTLCSGFALVPEPAAATASFGTGLSAASSGPSAS